MGNISKRFLSLLVAVVMVFSVVPASVFASETETTTELNKYTVAYLDVGQYEGKVTPYVYSYNHSMTYGAVAELVEGTIYKIYISDAQHSQFNVKFEVGGIFTQMLNNVEGNANKLYKLTGFQTVNDVQYNQIAVDGKLMTIDADKNVTVID